MATEAEIKGKISIDTGTSAKSINDLNKEIGETKKALKAAAIGSDEHKNAVKQLAAQTDKLKAATSGNNIEQSKAAGAFGVLKDRIGSVVPALKGAEGGASALNTGFKALIANPIGLILLAIVVALRAIYEAFANTFAGGQKVEQVFAGIKAVGQSLIDSLDKIGSAIKNVFTFNFGKAISDIKAVGTAAGEAYSKMAQLTKEKQKLDREEADNELDGIKRKAALADLKEKLNDGEVPIAEKKRLQKELMALAKQNAEEDLALAKRVADNKISQLTVQKEGDKKNYIEIQKIKGDQLRGEIENSNELRAIQKQGRALDKQEAAERKELADQEKARQKEASDKAKEYAAENKKRLEERIKAEQEYAKIIADGKRKEAAELDKLLVDMNAAQDAADAREAKRLADNEKTRLQNIKKVAELNTLQDPNSIQFKIAKINADLALELNALEAGDVQRSVLAQRAANDIVKIEADAAEAKKQISNSETENKLKNVSAIGGVLNSLSGLIGQQTAVGKGIAVASSLIDTYAAIVSTIRQAAKTPAGGIPGYAIAQGIATGIAGLAAVRNILKVQVPNASGGGGVSTLGNIAAPVTPQPLRTSTTLDQGSINGIGNAANGGTNRNFILDADINNNAERSRRINRAARLS